MSVSEKGFIPVMLTPFKEDGSIDFNVLEDLTEFYIKSGAKGLFANCQSSEMFELSAAERLSLIKHVVDFAKGRVPVVASGNFGDSISEQADCVKQVYGLGVQAVILLTNQLVGEASDEAELKRNIYELLSLTEGIPVGFYECPIPYKIIMPPQLLKELVDTGRVTYHKDTSLDIVQVSEKNRLCASASDFGLYDAYMVHAVRSLKSGSAGLSCIQGNYFPELIVWLCENYDSQESQHIVQQVQQFFIDNMNVMHKDYPTSVKYYLQKHGFPITAYTRYTHNSHVSGDTKKYMEMLEESYNALMRKVHAVSSVSTVGC
ncbi:MAG: dihydrodipicolinate synthase family protein [Niabella sp.]